MEKVGAGGGENGAAGWFYRVAGGLGVVIVGVLWFLIRGMPGLFPVLAHKITPCSAEKCEKRKASLSIVSQMS